TTKQYRVMQDGQQVGLLEMRDLVRALVPSGGSDDPDAARRAG
ncbi:glycine betaine/L-proline ABC transporter ATP-binding protein, partial [Pontibaca sp. S1109L]|nr:glycine betaine/L-proline ABC transporter ATP-binding protein [Pontibaca salina]